MKNLLENPEVIKWCYEGITEKTLAHTTNVQELLPYKEEEKMWGNKIVGGNTVQWTTVLCEGLVMEALIKLGRKNVRRAVKKHGLATEKNYSPDLECDNFVYEVKGRSWCTSGTAGEKILGVPMKYGEVPSLYKKPLKIVLVGYQEYEARKGFQFGDLLDGDEQTKEIKETLAYHKEHNIEYVAFTDILKEIGLTYYN